MTEVGEGETLVLSGAEVTQGTSVMQQENLVQLTFIPIPLVYLPSNFGLSPDTREEKTKTTNPLRAMLVVRTTVEVGWLKQRPEKEG